MPAVRAIEFEGAWGFGPRGMKLSIVLPSTSFLYPYEHRYSFLF